MEDLGKLFLNKDNFDNLTDKEFDWLLENEAEFVLEFNKRLRNRTITVDGRRIKNCSNARKWAIGFFNKRRQIQRQREFDKDVRNGQDTGKIRIVSEGDSWFNYPTKLQEVIDNLFNEFSRKVSGVLSRPADSEDIIPEVEEVIKSSTKISKDMPTLERYRQIRERIGLRREVTTIAPPNFTYELNTH